MSGDKKKFLIAKEILGRWPRDEQEIQLCQRIHKLEVENANLRETSAKVVPFSNMKIGNENLIAAASDPDLDKWATVMKWKDGSVNTGWSSGVQHSDLSYFLMLLDKKIRDEVCQEYTG